MFGLVGHLAVVASPDIFCAPSTSDKTSQGESMQIYWKSQYPVIQVPNQVVLDVYHSHCLSLIFD